MIYYDLTVTKLETNEHYEEQLKTWREQNRGYHTGDAQPATEFERREIKVRLTEQEYLELKGNIMATWA